MAREIKLSALVKNDDGVTVIHQDNVFADIVEMVKCRECDGVFDSVIQFTRHHFNEHVISRE